MRDRTLFPLTLIAIFFVRGMISFLTPVTADESYYLLWASHLDLSYVDHSGMVAWINSAFIYFFKEPLLSIRMASTVLMIITLMFIYRTAKMLSQSQSVARAAVILFLLIPHNFVSGIIMQVEQPLILFSAAGVYFFFRYVLSNKKGFLLPLSVCLGLAFLSKYTVLLLIIGMVVSLALSPTHRGVFKSWVFWLSVLVFMGIISPVIYWNFQHEWVSILFHEGRMGNSRIFEYFLPFLGDQIIHFSPVLWVYLWLVLKKGQRLPQEKILLILGGTVFVTFLCLSIVTKVYGHWTSIMYIPLTLFLARYIEKEYQFMNRHVGLFTGVLSCILLVVGPSVLAKQNDIRNNYNMSSIILEIQHSKPDDVMPVFANLHGSIGQLSYYGRTQVYMPAGHMRMAGIWGEPQFRMWHEAVTISKGGDALYYGFSNEKIQSKLLEKFKQVTVVEEFKLTLLEGYISQFVLYHCQDAKDFFIF
ncbi:MAG: glycosyltransferase family 39 protein [Candidatus Margulisbacteria bacterium]|nr:glycosyltransferase family 39 protein [Candidatus Margulisiibacteriota bacterium]